MRAPQGRGADLAVLASAPPEPRAQQVLKKCPPRAPTPNPTPPDPRPVPASWAGGVGKQPGGGRLVKGDFIYSSEAERPRWRARGPGPGAPRRLPPGTETLAPATRFPFFPFFFSFWYKMIQTTIQNSCAVDGYKRSRDAASARRPEGLCRRGSLPRLSPRQAQSCGLRHVCPFPKRNMQKKKKQTNRDGARRARSGRRGPIVRGRSPLLWCYSSQR